jgi:hypothetical protein
LTGRGVWRLPDVSVPSPGFGSSGCNIGSAHLLRLPDGLALDDLTADIPFLVST